jgi:hypothetical protein
MSSVVHKKPSRRSLLLSDVENRSLDGELPGYWFESLADVPASRPAYDPNGAILLNANGDRAIVLIDFEGISLPLSDAAEMIYSGPRAIKEGRGATFVVPATSSRRAWPGRVFQLDRAPYLTQRGVVLAYGPVAGRRARPDKKTIQVAVQLSK